MPPDLNNEEIRVKGRRKHIIDRNKNKKPSSFTDKRNKVIINFDIHNFHLRAGLFHDKTRTLGIP